MTARLHCLQSKKYSQVLLSTAIVNIADSDGNYHKARCLLDSGSQSSFLSSGLLKKLRLPLTKVNLPVLGVNQVSTYIKCKTQTNIKSTYNNFQANVQFLVLNKITSNIPVTSFDISQLKIPEHLRLADPEFYISGDIDILLGASLFFDILCSGQIKLGIGMPTLQKSMLGWLVAGPLTIISQDPNEINNCLLSVNQEVQDQLERFWSVEECAATVGNKIMSSEHMDCERNFLETTSRDETGKFVVTLPMRENVDELGDTFETAKKRFFYLEQKLQKNNEFKEKYCAFMNEYLEMGHMTKIDADENDSDFSNEKRIFYLPHHGVVNESSETTKLK